MINRRTTGAHIANTKPDPHVIAVIDGDRCDHRDQHDSDDGTGEIGV